MTITAPDTSSVVVPIADSPRASQSPAPPGLQGDLELELLGLANALYNLGTTVINDSTKDKDKSGGKQVGIRVYAPGQAPRLHHLMDTTIEMKSLIISQQSMKWLLRLAQ